jgi:phosphohistidine phosphatase SixA
MRIFKINHLVALCVTGFLVCTLAGCAAYMSNSIPGTETTIILTRHAEKTAFTNDLTEKGRARAQSLARILADKNVTAIFCPDITRNLDTAGPLAKKMNIKITVVSSTPHPDKVVKAMLTQHSGGVVLWVGNTSNLSEIYSQLGGKGEAPDNYGDLYIMKIKDQGAPEVVKMRYEAR